MLIRYLTYKNSVFLNLAIVLGGLHAIVTPWWGGVGGGGGTRK